MAHCHCLPAFLKHARHSNRSNNCATQHCNGINKNQNFIVRNEFGMCVKYARRWAAAWATLDNNSFAVDTATGGKHAQPFLPLV